MRTAHQHLLMALALTACEREYDFPDVRATSKYIEYSTWADDANVCMDDHLKSFDRFIDTTATFLKVDPPPRLRYIWIPRSIKDADNWPCPLDTSGCYVEEVEPHVVLSERVDHPHELVHAVATNALGRSHWILSEGLAEYLGQSDTTPSATKDFPAQFLARIEVDPDSDDYRRAMHYVGSLIEQHGVDKLKELMHAVPLTASAEEFASAHHAVYGEPLATSLAQMTTPINGQIATTCDGGELVWGAAPDLEVTLRGECGDGYFYSGGSIADEYESYKKYVVNVPVAGPYTIHLKHAGETAVALGLVRSCPGVDFGTTDTIHGDPGIGLLNPGLHQITIGFPSGSGPAPELDLQLSYEGDGILLPAAPRVIDPKR
jgi:hypothetical protein